MEGKLTEFMQERIVELILYLVNELKTNKNLSDVDVAALAREGYTQSEITTAFSWLFDRMSTGQPSPELSPRYEQSHRVLHEAEKLVISPEAFGYLLQFRQLGLLTNQDVETILERIMAAGFGTVGVAEARSFVAGILFDAENPRNGSSHFSLGSNDSIH